MASLCRHPVMIGSFSPLKRIPAPMATAGKPSSAYASPSHPGGRKLPVLLFDIMDTVVRDPFYEDVPAFFRVEKYPFCKPLLQAVPVVPLYVDCLEELSPYYLNDAAVEEEMILLLRLRMPMKELLEYKHPTAWMEFEMGLIDEMELARRFFKDGTPVDLEGLKECMKRGYSYIDGIEDLLQNLKRSNYEMHAFTNYPIWYLMIEEKLKISTYLSWTFCSCTIGKRKPAADLYLEVCERLGVDPAGCIFIDDRITNVEAAVAAGMVGIHFKGATSLRQDLTLLGVQTEGVNTDKSRNEGAFHAEEN